MTDVCLAGLRLRASAVAALLGVVAMGWGAAAAGAQPGDVAPLPPAGVSAVYVMGGDAAEVAFTGERATTDDFSRAENAQFSAAAAHSGAAGVQLSAQQAPGFVGWEAPALAQGHNYVSAQFWVRLDSRAQGESVDLFTISNQQRERNFDFFVAGGSGRFKWDIFREASAEAAVVDEGRWYFVQVTLSYSGTTHWAEVRIDGQDLGRIESPGVDTTVESVTLGAKTAKTHSQAYDDVVVHLGHTPTTWDRAAQASPRVALRWHPPAEEGPPLQEYEIWRNGTWHDRVPAGVTTYVDTAPVSGATYRIRSIGLDGSSSPWSAGASVPVVGVGDVAGPVGEGNGVEFDEQAEADAPRPPEVTEPDDAVEPRRWRDRFDILVMAWVDDMTQWWRNTPA